MKTSQLIKKLQRIEKDVPFDADVVTGDDWQPTDLARVYHEPPYTFLEFNYSSSEEAQEESITFNEEQKVLVLAYITSMLQEASSQKIGLADAANSLIGLVEFCQTNSPSSVIERLREINAATPGSPLI